MTTSAPDLRTSCRRLSTALDLLGRRWVGGILLALGDGADRFSDVLRSVPGLSDRMLAARLRELEQRGAVTRTVVPSTPVQIRYALTDHGRDLLEALLPLLTLELPDEQADATRADERADASPADDRAGAPAAGIPRRAAAQR